MSTPIEQQNARYAIDGAILKGRLGIDPPPAGHWLAEYYEMGRRLAEPPEGYVLVPRTPTDDMLNAGAIPFHLGDKWEAMLAAVSICPTGTRTIPMATEPLHRWPNANGPMTPRQIAIDALREAFLAGERGEMYPANAYAEAAADALLAKLSAAMVPVAWRTKVNDAYHLTEERYVVQHWEAAARIAEPLYPPLETAITAAIVKANVRALSTQPRGGGQT